MVVGEIADSVDLLVVGAGPGGYVAAVRAAQLGRDVVLVDRAGPEGGPGGCCLQVGCIPSKALIELARARERATSQPGLVVDAAAIDLAAFQAYKREMVGGLADGVRGLLRRHGVGYLEGSLRFNRPDRAAVLLPDGNVQFLEFAQAIIATGSRPAELPFLPTDGDRVLTSSDALALDAVPDSVAIVGGGYIGLEIGTALAKLGSRVTIVEAMDRVLPTVDASLTKPVLRRLATLGADVHLSTFARAIVGDHLIADGPAGEIRVPAAKIVIAVGRVPNTDDLGLRCAGVPIGEDGLIPVDSQMLATPDVAAIGDVVAGPALAHKASAEGLVAAEALSGRPAAFDATAIPQVVFTDPEIASVGLSGEQAREEGYDAIVGRWPLGASGRAATLGARDGFVHVVIDREGDRVLGVHVVGPHASELIAEGALAVEMQAAPDDLLGTIHPHPTVSEGLQAAVEQAVARVLA